MKLVKMRSHWIRVALNPITSVLKRGEEFGPRQNGTCRLLYKGKATWRPFPGVSGGITALPHLDSKPPASQTVELYISAVLSHLGCGPIITLGKEYSVPACSNLTAVRR